MYFLSFAPAVALLVASICPPSVLAAESSGAVTAPAGCRKLKTDSDWPPLSAWQAALPGIIAKPTNTAAAAPDYTLRAKTVQDVQKAVKFAADNNIRFSVIATGHDFDARSTAASGLLIDVSLLNGVKVLESFTPTKEGVQSVVPGQEANVITPKAGSQSAVTFGAGLTTQTLNTAISPSKLFTNGAAHGTVAPAGGWGQMGGHAPFSAQLGLGVDQWLEAKVVTADGKLVVANSVSNPDLFWAIRGGGGGTFGVVVEATIKAHQDRPITALVFWITPSAANGQGIKDSIAYLLGQMPDLHAKGVSGYFNNFGTSFLGIALHLGDNSDIPKVNAIWKPILEKMQSYPGVKKFQSKPFHFQNYKTFFDTGFGVMGMEDMKRVKRHEPGEVVGPPVSRGRAPMDSRLLSAADLRSPQLASSMPTSWEVMLVGPADRVGNGSDTSANPAWRKAIVHVLTLRVSALGQNVVSTDGLRKLSPSLGVYGNEAFYGETNWQTAFWGTNYPRLSQIKTQYDPNMVFWVTPGVNAEKMNVVSGRVCKTQGNVRTDIPPETDNTIATNLLELQEIFGRFLPSENKPPEGQFEGLQTVSVV